MSWLLVVTKRDKSKAMDFLNMMKRVGPPIGIEVCMRGGVALRYVRGGTALRYEGVWPMTPRVCVEMVTSSWKGHNLVLQTSNSFLIGLQYGVLRSVFYFGPKLSIF